jgi:glyoxylase-like metal-dependent hydrolase (beta-lactamase superfamily II)
VVVCHSCGHTHGHSVVRLASGGDRLTFAGDLVFAPGFDPDWYNGFAHDPEEAARVRVRLLRELAATGEPLVATHLYSGPSAGWRSPATSFVGYRPSGSTDRFLRVGPN